MEIKLLFEWLLLQKNYKMLWVGRAVIIRWSVVAVITLVAIFYAYSLISKSQAPLESLPVYGLQDGATHRVSDFSLINQEGKKITANDYTDKIYVADFFFASCQSICPVMSDQMERVATAFGNNQHVMFLSHSVKPDEDSVPILKQYAIDHHANSQWNFVTGDINQINDLAIHSYLMADSETVFVHTPSFALIDPQKRIRGYYDGTDSAEVNKLITDIGVLLNENNLSEKK
jgi:protein SCO1/2